MTRKGMRAEGIAALLLILIGANAFEEIHYSKDGYCPQLTHISLGRVRPDSLAHSRTAVVGAVAHYTCAHGYEIEGNPNRTCVNSVHGLHWEPLEKPRCHSRRCPPINGFENGYVFEGTRLPGSTNVFSCYPSHVLVGARFIRCQSNWTWDNTAPSCVRACPLTPPLENGHYNETFAPIGQSVRAICDRCHRANVTLLRCGQDGNFEQPYPVCDPMLCPTPFGRAVQTGVIVEYMCDSIAKFDCPSGTTLVGANNVTCLENGTWSTSLPSCNSLSPAEQQIGGDRLAPLDLYLVDGCVLPENILNGDFMLKLPGNRIGETFIVDGTNEEKEYDLDLMLGHLAPGQERIVPEGTVTQYSCDHGYRLEGNERRGCVAGEWQGGLPECVAITCPPPEEDAAGLGYYVMEGNIVGDTASFRCYDGYYSNNLPHVVTCSAEGNWTGGKHPFCEKISCGFPPAYDDVELVGDDFKDAVTLRCHDVDANVTSNIDISCQTNGRWNLESWISCSLGGQLAVCPWRLDCNNIAYAVVGTLLHQNNTHVQVDVTGVLFPNTVQPRVHMIRQFILPVSMRCCNRLVLGNSYLFTGHLFGGKLFTRGCVDIFYYRHDNQTRLLYSRSSATLASFRPFCPNRL